MNTDIFPANEIVGAIVGNMASAEQVAIFAKDPEGVLASQLDIRTEATFSVVENSADTVHLALPYYAMVEDMQAQILADDSIGDVAGGEIFISVCALAGLLIAKVLMIGAPLAAITGLVAGAAVGTTILSGVAVGVDRHIPEGK